MDKIHVVGRCFDETASVRISASSRDIADFAYRTSLLASRAEHRRDNGQLTLYILYFWPFCY